MSAFDKKKTVTDLQIVDLLEVDYAVRQAKFTSWYQSGGNMGLFNESYWYWKRSFRGFYSERYLARSGFLPSTETEKIEILEPELLTYLQTVNPDILGLVNFGKRVATPDYIARLYIQDNSYNYSNNTDILVENVEISPGVFRDNFYTMMSATYLIGSDEATIEITFTGGYYENDVEPIPPETLPALGDPIAIPDKIVTFANDFKDIQTLICTIEYTSDPSPEWFVYLEDWATVPASIHTTETLVMTAIIPIKENNVFTKEDLFMKRFLNKMGLGGKQLVDSLTTTEEGDPSPVDNAYIMEGLPFDSTHQPVIKTLFNSFEYMSNGVIGQIYLGIATLNMTYEFTVNIEVITGELGAGLDPKGRPIYATSEIVPGVEIDPEIIPGVETDPGPGSSLIIKYQTEPGFYREMTVTNYVQTYEINSQGQIRKFTGYFTSEKDIGRLIVPLDILNDLKFKDYVPVHEHAFCMVAYAIETTTIKWYQRIAGFVIGIILGVLFGPAGFTLYQLIINVVINAVIALAVSFVLAAIDNPWITAIVGIVMAVFGQLGNLDLSSLTVENFLPLANSVIDGASGVYADYIKEEMEKVQKEAEEQAKEDKDKLDSLKPSVDIAAVLRSTMMSFEQTTNPDVWIDSQLGNGMFDFDQYYNVTGEIESRKQVVPG